MSERRRTVQRIDNLLTECCQKFAIPILTRGQQRLAANSFAAHIKKFVCVDHKQKFDESWRVDVEINRTAGLPKYTTVYLKVKKDELESQFGIGFPEYIPPRSRTKK